MNIFQIDKYIHHRHLRLEILRASGLRDTTVDTVIGSSQAVKTNLIVAESICIGAY